MSYDGLTRYSGGSITVLKLFRQIGQCFKIGMKFTMVRM